MQYPKSTKRVPATQARAEKFGLANQISYEADSRRKRNELSAKLKADHAAARAAGAKRAAKMAASTSGVNAGTIGGAYLQSFQPQQRKKK